MTPLRQAFHAALMAAGLAVSTPAWAEPLTAMGPPTAEDAAAAEAAAKAAADAAAAKAAPATSAKAPPSWLATRPQPKASAATGKSALPSGGRMVGLVLVLGALGAATLYFKRRGKVDVKSPVAQQRLRVLSSTRIGPKAHAVVITVAGRQMLLGVTDSSVKRLAFIDELEEDAEERAHERAERAPAVRPNPLATRAAAIAVRTVSPEPAPAKAGSFADLLKTAFGKRAPVEASDAASILAAETHDTVGGKPVAPKASNVRMIDVEGQAQGLMRRLSGTRE